MNHDTTETIIAAVREWQEASEQARIANEAYYSYDGPEYIETRMQREMWRVEAIAHEKLQALRALRLPPNGFVEEREARLMAQQHDMGRVAGWNDAMKGEKGPVTGYRDRHES